MHLSQPALKTIIAVLLSSTHYVSAAPSGSPSIKTREDTFCKDDKLPKGNAADLIAWTDDDYADDVYKDAPDYDPDQDQEPEAKKRSVGASLFTRAGNPAKDKTEWLRSVGYNGVPVTAAFKDSENPRWIGDIGKLNKGK